MSQTWAVGLTYLQHIFIIMGGHLLEFWPVCCYSPYAIDTKRRNFVKAKWMLVSGPRSSAGAYRQSNSCFKFSFLQSRRCSSWMKTAFQMPCSTLGRRSTTSMSNTLKLSGNNLSENTFWNDEHVINYKTKRTLTAIGTKESSFMRVSTAMPSTAEFPTKIASHTSPMCLCHTMSSMRGRDSHSIISSHVPILCTQSSGVRHQGQGQRLRLWMPAKSILT